MVGKNPFWARVELRGSKGNPRRMGDLRRMLARDVAGLHRASDDQVIELAIRFLRREQEEEAPEQDKKWKVVPGEARGPVRRTAWRLQNSVVVKAADLAPGDEYLDPAEAAQMGFAPMASAPEAKQVMAEIAPGKPAGFGSVLQELQEAFRTGKLVMLKPKEQRALRTGGGGGGGNTQGGSSAADSRGSGGGGSSSGSSGGSKSTAGSSGGSKSPASDAAPADEKTWFRVQVMDEDGLPMADEDYLLVDSSGAKRQGKLDSNGELYIPPVLPPGNCTFSLPNMHLNPRKRKN